MSSKKKESDQNRRQRAEQKLDTSDDDFESSSHLETKQLLHELLVHQVELEMQNEELRSAHQLLDDSRSRYFNLYDLAPIGYITLTDKRMIQDCNLFASSMMGLNRDALINTPVSKILLKSDQNIFYKRLNLCLELGYPQHFEMRFVRANSDAFWGLVQIIITESGEYWLTITDISESKLSEAKLKESDNKFRSIFEQAALGVARVDLNGDWLEVNKKLCDIMGYSPSELLSKTTENIVHSEDLKNVHCATNQLLNEEIKNYSNEQRYYTKTGDVIWVNLTMSLVRDIHNQPDYFIFIVEDITTQKDSENKQITLTKQLQQAQKMEAIGNLAGGIAHDFNNMLGVIIGHCELGLSNIAATNALTENLKAISKAASHSAKLTRQLLTFARKQTIEPKVLSLNSSVSDMIQMLDRTIGESIRLSWKPTDDLWPVKVDPTQLDQVLVNLCINARDAISSMGEISITATNCVIDDSTGVDDAYDIPLGEYVKLSVSDNGCGMDDATMSHIFEPFFTTKAIGTGTGLGLSSIFGAVKMNHGFINVFSELDKGTRFNIYFCRAEPLKKKSQKVTKTDSCEVTETILLVEDEESLLEIQSFVLERTGYTVLTASSGEQAEALLKKHSSKVDLLLSDVVMPDINGMELCDKLQRLHPELKVVFMSGHSSDAIGLQHKLEEGAFFLQKPFSITALTDKVREALTTD